MTAVVFLKKTYQISEAQKGFEYIPAEDHEERVWAKRADRRAINTSGSLLDSEDDGLATVNAKFKPMIPTSSSAPELVHAKLPDWTEGQVLWKKYGNKVRGGRAGVVVYTGPTSVVV